MDEDGDGETTASGSCSQVYTDLDERIDQQTYKLGGQRMEMWTASLATETAQLCCHSWPIHHLASHVHSLFPTHTQLDLITIAFEKIDSGVEQCY